MELFPSGSPVAVGGYFGHRLSGLRLSQSSSTFSPTSLTGLQLWLKADALVLNDADPVATWTDSSTSANHFTQAVVGQRPVYKTGIVNSKPVVRFDGVDDFLGATSAGLAALTAATVFIIFKVNVDPPAASAQCGLWDFTTDNVNSTVLPFTDGVWYDSFGSSARKTTVDPAPSLTSFRNYCVTSTANAWTSYLDGTQLFTTAVNTFGITSAVKLGESRSIAYHLAGDVPELLIYDSVLSPANRQSVEGYLRSKYALS